MNKYECLMEIMKNDDMYSVKQLASNEKVKAHNNIMYGDGYDLNSLAQYVEKYGFDTVNAIVADMYAG